MISIDIELDNAMAELNKNLDLSSKGIEKDSRKALEKTALDVKYLVYNNMSKKRNAYNEVMEKEEDSTIIRKGFSSPLRDTTRMQRGIVSTKINDEEYWVEFTEKNVIYAKYLNTRKNWQVLKVTDYIIKNVIRLFKKNYSN